MSETEPTEVVRARRFELVGDDGRTIAVLGDLGGTPDAPFFGLALLDERGGKRLWIGLDHTGPSLMCATEGNAVLALGVNDPEPDCMLPGPYIQLMHLDGSRRALVWCAPDGAVGVEVADASLRFA
jgi:hypothetical protein